jgi:hypothetical protein
MMIMIIITIILMIIKITLIIITFETKKNYFCFILELPCET